MDEPQDQEALAVISEFLAKFLVDHSAAAVQPLAKYQASYPGYESLIAAEYDKLTAIPPATEAAPQDTSQPDVQLPDELQHQAIGPYSIVSAVGEGGMGSVYIAEQTEPIRRRVAVKLIKLGMDTVEVLARFDSERQALALMNHPNIARVYDAGATSEGRPYFVMEYVPGVPITDFCDRHRLTTAERLAIFLQICDAVQHAHQKGIIHRDLKPSNVLVAFEDDKPVSKVIDFGIAKSTSQRLTEKTLFTEQGQLIGTPAYMSPEQAEMSALDVDTRSDIYSMGVLLYEVLVGTLPFDSESLRQAGYAEMQRRLVEDEPPTPSLRFGRLGDTSTAIAAKRRSDVRALLRQLRGDLDWITMKALEKDRGRRYASASEFAADIRRHLDDEPVAATPPSLVYRLRKFTRKNRIRLTVGLAMILVLVTSLTASFYVSAEKARQEQAARREKLHEDGLADWKTHDELKQKRDEFVDAWRKAKARHAGWEPVWKRADELRAWADVEKARRLPDEYYSRSVVSLKKAIDEAVPESVNERQITQDLERLFFERRREAVRLGSLEVSPEFFRGSIEALGLGTYDAELEGGGTVAFASDPPAAELFCFRYKKYEEHLLPIPFRPASASFVGEPFLEVESTREDGRSPFRADDRLVEAAGVRVGLRGDLAAVLVGVSQGRAIDLKVLRDGREEPIEWVPFPASRPEHGVYSFYEQFGLTFAGYPLDFVEECRVGTTGEGAPLTVELPKGSYLFVFKKPGFLPARFPVSLPWEKDAETAYTVKLVRETEVPPHFVYVPAGPVACGGDETVDQAMQRDFRTVEGFFISRLEVTVDEYTEFLNDPQITARIDREKGTLQVTSSSDETPVAVSSTRGTRFFDWVDGNWMRGKPLKNRKWPILSVPQLVADEYARWLTRKHAGRWEFRLPTDLEWEKAARGVDRRPYVWGDYAVWSFCRSHFGIFGPQPQPDVVGRYPLDESVFGVRDLAGSVTEPTRDTVGEGFISLRGGSWNTFTEYFYRVANRQGRKPIGKGTDQGIRLVAELQE